MRNAFRLTFLVVLMVPLLLTACTPRFYLPPAGKSEFDDPVVTGGTGGQAQLVYKTQEGEKVFVAGNVRMVYDREEGTTEYIVEKLYWNAEVHLLVHKKPKGE